MKADHSELLCKSFNSPDILALSSWIKNKRTETGKHVLAGYLLVAPLTEGFLFFSALFCVSSHLQLKMNFTENV